MFSTFTITPRLFPCFLLMFLRKRFVIQSIFREGKRLKSLGARLGIMVIGVEDINLNPIFFPPWMWPCVIMEKFNVSSIDKCRRFLRRFSYTHCSCWDYTSASRAWLRVKNLKWIILQWSHHTYRLTFLSWSSAFTVGCGDCCYNLHLKNRN